MTPDPLDSLLAEYSAEPLPLGSNASSAEIWRRIELRRQQSVWLRLTAVFSFGESFVQPRMTLVALTMALVVGIVPAAVASRTQNERRMARHSIHFEVFALDSRLPGALFLKPAAESAGTRR
ncbi:MAG: hypothetical protein ABIZ04_07740 [Opitutus sp.]